MTNRKTKSRRSLTFEFHPEQGAVAALSRLQIEGMRIVAINRKINQVTCIYELIEETKDKATDEQTEAPASKKPAAQGRATSKRQGWKAATFYLKPETLAQLRRVVLERKLEGETGDLSDAVEEALEAWLNPLGDFCND